MNHFTHFFKQKCQRFAGSGFLNVRISCISLSFMTVNEEFLSVLGCWFEQKKYGLHRFGLWEIPVSIFPNP